MTIAATETPSTPDGTATPVPQSVTAPAPAAPALAAEPSFIKERLERERRAVLKDLGVKVKKGDDSAEKIREFKADKEERKAQRAAQAAKIAQQGETIEKLSASEAAVKVYSDVEFKLLTPAQQDIVARAAGDDPAERLRVISIMKATAPEAKTEDPKAAKSAPIPAPAQTAPNSGSPEVSSSNPPDVRTEYSRLAKANPLLAAAYLLQNRHDFYKQ